MASGKATSHVGRRPHWIKERAAKGEMVRYVDATWDVILNPDAERLLQVATIQSDGIPQVHWNTQSSGILIEATVAQLMETLWSSHIDDVRGSLEPSMPGPDGDSEELEFPEGKVSYRLHRQHERNPLLAKRKKAAILASTGSLACAICGFDFFKTYGPVGKQFIECHHTIPVSELCDGVKTKLSDVVVVCSNCHRMLHRRRPWLHIDELTALLK
jgi:5-methylcytosine-specific restriction protein A